VCDVACELGVNHATLRNWVSKAKLERVGTGGATSEVLSSDERAELTRLRRPVARRQLETEMADHLRTELILEAVGMANHTRRPARDQLIHRSDCGTQAVHAGTSPITRASDSRRVVLARYARNRRLADAVHSGHSARCVAHPRPRLLPIPA
jgi:hypothetical protein